MDSSARILLVLAKISDPSKQDIDWVFKNVNALKRLQKVLIQSNQILADMNPQQSLMLLRLTALVITLLTIFITSIFGKNKDQVNKWIDENLPDIMKIAEAMKTRNEQLQANGVQKYGYFRNSIAQAESLVAFQKDIDLFLEKKFNESVFTTPATFSTIKERILRIPFIKMLMTTIVERFSKDQKGMNYFMAIGSEMYVEESFTNDQILQIALITGGGALLLFIVENVILWMFGKKRAREMMADNMPEIRRIVDDYITRMKKIDQAKNKKLYTWSNIKILITELDKIWFQRRFKIIQDTSKGWFWNVLAESVRRHALFYMFLLIHYNGYKKDKLQEIFAKVQQRYGQKPLLQGA